MKSFRWLKLMPLWFVEWYVSKWFIYKEIAYLGGGRYYVFQGPGTRLKPVRVILFEINVADRYWYPVEPEESIRNLVRPNPPATSNPHPAEAAPGH